MIRFVCAIKDSAVQTFGQPIFVPALGAAVRSFMDEVKREAPDNMLSLHPEDFELWYLCKFDDEAGVFEAQDEVRCLLRGKDAVLGINGSSKE